MNARGFKRVVAAAAVLTLCGCGEKLTHQNWLTIDVGASPARVERALGKPSWSLGQKWIYRDDDRQITAYVWFDGEKVVGTWWKERDFEDGKGPDVNQPGHTETIEVQTIE